jgi:hypothetical protein
MAIRLFIIIVLVVSFSAFGETLTNPVGTSFDYQLVGNRGVLFRESSDHQLILAVSWTF